MSTKPVPFPARTLGAIETPRADTALPRLWRPRDLARHWGIARQTVYSLIRRGHLPAFRLAGAIRIREDDLLSYLRRCERSG